MEPQNLRWSASPRTCIWNCNAVEDIGIMPQLCRHQYHGLESQSASGIRDRGSGASGAAAEAIRKWVTEQCKRGFTPRAVGEQVLVAIRNERFYILTHPEYNPIIEQRMKDILGGANPTVPPPPRGGELLTRTLEGLRPN